MPLWPFFIFLFLSTTTKRKTYTSNFKTTAVSLCNPSDVMAFTSAYFSSAGALT